MNWRVGERTSFPALHSCDVSEVEGEIFKV